MHIPGFTSGRFVRGMWGAVLPVLLHVVGDCTLQECKSPFQSIPVVVGHYIDKCITALA